MAVPTEPQTSLHYAPNANISSTGSYAPGADGFNLADVSSKGALDALPSGVKGLVWLGMGNGADATFQSTVSQYARDSNLFGFYLFDEPDPTGQWNTQVSAANLKAESDWIHAHVPGAKTFMALMNMGTPQNPSYANTYNPANTDIDLFGLDPYPVRPQFSGGADFSVIPAAVSAAQAAGIPLSAIVPVYQAFGGGGYSSYTMPTVDQEKKLLQAWGSVVPNPAFDYTYSWGNQNGDTALVDSPDLQTVFAAHNAGTSTGSGGTPAPTFSSSTMSVTDTARHMATVQVLASGSYDYTGSLNTTLHQVFSSGVDKVSSTATISLVTLNLASGNEKLSFAGPQSVHVNGGSGSDQVSVASGKNTFTAGSGTLDVTGGSGADTYVYNARSGTLIIENYTASQNDNLTVSSSLRSSMQKTTDGHGGTLLTFGSNHSIDLVGVSPSSFSTRAIHFA
jgi:hypothetical protein